MRSTYLTGPLSVFIAAPFAYAVEQQSVTGRSSAITGWSLITIASATITLIALVALVYFIRRFLIRRAQRAKHDPAQLLRELCQAHGLSRRAERLLRKAAAAVGTPHPARLFLEPKLLRQAEECSEMKRSRRIISLLYERLYGEDAD